MNNSESNAIVPFTILHIPHSATIIPDEVRPSLTLSNKELERELLLITDKYTDELFQSENQSITSIIFPISRLVVDPERFIDDSKEIMASKGMGVIYTKTTNGKPLRKAFSDIDRSNLLSTYYFPHHQKLAGAVLQAIKEYGYCLIIDCHSFPSQPSPHELDQNPNRPDICIGTDDYHTPNWLSDLAMALSQKAGFITRVNSPFTGSIVPEAYYRLNYNVSSIMIEVNRSLYMDEDAGLHSPQFSPYKSKLQAIIKSLIGAYQNKYYAESESQSFNERF